MNELHILKRLKGVLIEFNILSQIGWNFIFKAIGTLLSFLIISISIKYLGSEVYGSWAAVFAIIGWLSILDLGVGSSLKNSIGENNSSKNLIKLKSIISTTYVALFTIALVVWISFELTKQYVSWDYLFNNSFEQETLKIVAKNIFYTFLVIFIGKISFAILNANHKSHFGSISIAVTNLILMALLFYFQQVGQNKAEKLVIYSRLILISNFITYFFINSITYLFFFKELIPNPKLFDISILKPIFRLGKGFLILQFNTILLYSTDIFLLNKFSSGMYAASYAVLQKYYGISIVIMSIIITPFWSAIVSCRENKSFDLIRKYFQSLIGVSIFLTILNTFLLLLQTVILNFWVGNSMKPSILSGSLMALYSSILCFFQIYGTFQNGFGDIKLQAYYSSVASMINIILTYVGLKFLEYGLDWALFVSILVHVPAIWIYHKKVSKIIKVFK